MLSVSTEALRIHHISCGSFRPPCSALTQGGTGCGLIKRGEYVIHCLLIELPPAENEQASAAGGATRLVLIDTGLGRLDMQHPLRRLGWGMALFAGATAGETAAEAVARMGYAASDVAHVLLTHADKDHTGGLADFPQAIVHLHAGALEAVHKVQQRRARLTLRERTAPSHLGHSPLWQAFETPMREGMHSTESPAFPASDSDEIPALLSSLFPGTRTLPGLPSSILAVPLAGHAAGHCGYAINTEAGWLLHCGDSVYHRAWLDGGRPPLLIQLVERLLQDNAIARRHNRDALQQLQSGGRLRICSSHDARAFRELCGLP